MLKVSSFKKKVGFHDRCSMGEALHEQGGTKGLRGTRQGAQHREASAWHKHHAQHPWVPCCCHQAPTELEVLQRHPPRPRGIKHPYRPRDPATRCNHATKPNPEPKHTGKPSEECMYVKIQVLHVGRRGNAVCQQKHGGTKVSEPSPTIPIPPLFVF